MIAPVAHAPAPWPPPSHLSSEQLANYQTVPAPTPPTNLPQTLTQPLATGENAATSSTATTDPTTALLNAFNSLGQISTGGSSATIPPSSLDGATIVAPGSTDTTAPQSSGSPLIVLGAIASIAAVAYFAYKHFHKA